MPRLLADRWLFVGAYRRSTRALTTSEEITEWRRSIDDATVETFDFDARTDAKRKAGSRRKASERGLREVRDVAGAPQGREPAKCIEEEVRTEERFPSAREVHKRGAKTLRENSHEVSTGDWLGA